MQDANTKQQIVEKIKSSTNILVTVGASPSVDELSAALALALMLTRMDKHSTAVFSGSVPPAIQFLEPEKTFEDSVDSLRDFIIALDKEKADRLRYKLEGDVVRIFITPFKTVLSEKDLQFSQGDFNVELIVALGVEKRDDLDKAITAHGRILHDATVVTINRNGAQSSLGSLDWTDAQASSLCEMLMSLSESLQSGLLDQQISTALLTGIVSATDRFRNERTTPKVMTMSAQLMAAGANQQLIAEKLEAGHGLDAQPEALVVSETAKDLPEGDTSKKLEEPTLSKDEKKEDGALEIMHTPEPTPQPPATDPSDDALKEAEAALAENLEQQKAVAPTPSLDELKKDLETAEAEQAAPASSPEPESTDTAGPKIVKEHRSWQTDDTAQTPSFGGTLNATTSDAEEEKRREDNSAFNRQLLDHDAPQASTETASPVPASEPAQVVPALPPLPTAAPDIPVTEPNAPSEQPEAPVPSGPTLSEIDSQTRGKAADEARAAVDAVLSGMPFDAAREPLESSGAIQAIHVDHDGTLMPAAQAPQPAPVASAPSATTPPDLSGLPVPPPLPPLPDFSTLPPLPPAVPPVVPMPAQEPALQAAPSRPVSTDPGQFRIPGQ